MNILCLLGFHNFTLNNSNHAFCKRCGSFIIPQLICKHEFIFNKDFGWTYQELECKHCGFKKIVEKQ